MTFTLLSPGAGLVLFLLLTIALLTVAVITGLRAMRRIHIPVVVVALLSLVITILYAERLGRLYDLEAAGHVTTVHLLFAKVTTAAFVLPIATGIRALKHPHMRRLHRRIVTIVLTLVAVTAALGVWMMVLADPI